MNDTIHYHAARAKTEIDRVLHAASEDSARCHLELAQMHLAKSRSADLIEQMTEHVKRVARPVIRTDKEA